MNQNRKECKRPFRPLVSTVHIQFKPLPSVFNLPHCRVRAYVQSTLLLLNMLIKGNIINAVSQQCRPLLPNWVKHTSTHCRSANRHANRQTHPCAHITVNSYRDRRMTCVCGHGKVYLCISGRDLHRHALLTCAHLIWTTLPIINTHAVADAKSNLTASGDVFSFWSLLYVGRLQDCGCVGVRDLMCL